MQVRQAALGGFLAAALIFGASASPVVPTNGQVSVAGTVGQIDRQTAAVFDGLRSARNAALDVVFDAVGALIAQAKQI